MDGYPPRKSRVCEMAEEIRCQWVANINDASIILIEYPPIRQQWVDRFLWHHDLLQTAFA